MLSSHVSQLPTRRLSTLSKVAMQSRSMTSMPWLATASRMYPNAPPIEVEPAPRGLGWGMGMSSSRLAYMLDALEEEAEAAVERSTPMSADAVAQAFMDVPIDFRVAPPELNHTVAGVIHAHYWTGFHALPEHTFQLDARGHASLDTNSAFAEDMRQMYRETGLVHVMNSGLSSLSDMSQVARHALPSQIPYVGGANPRHALEGDTPNVFDVGAPLTSGLHYHKEMAYVTKCPETLAFMCTKATAGKGQTYFSDALQATDELMKTDLGRKLKEKGVCYVRNLTNRNAFKGKMEVGVYNHWQLSMGTEDRAEAERVAASQGLVIEWGPDGLLKTRFYADAFEYCPYTDRNLIHASLADDGMWFDSWPLVMHLPYEDRPLALTYGDDTPFTRAEKEQWTNLYDRFGIEVAWSKGDICVFCNYRFLHGRPGIHLEAGEERQIGVTMGSKFERQGSLAGKW